MNLLIAIAVVAAGWWLIKAFGRAKPADLRHWKTKAIGIVMLAGALLLGLRGNIELALPLLVIGMGILGKDALLPEFLRPRGRGSAGSQQSPPPRSSRGRMTRAEALHVLGLEDGANAEHVREAHRRLLKSFHPDKGGTNYLAAKINEAKDVLLG